MMVWAIQSFYGITYSVRAFVNLTAAGLGNLPGVIAAGLGVGAAGAISAFQLVHFEPLETAYQTINLSIFMVVCVLLGGKGTLWGPVS